MKTLLMFSLVALLGLQMQAQAQIEAGAALEISIQGVPPSEQSRINAMYPVSQSGFITMWEIGSIKAAGLNSDTLARRIEQAYRNAEIYTSPTIQVRADDTQNINQQLITIGGKVRAPGPKPFTRGMTLYQAVMAAGGPTEFGALNRVKLFRGGKAYTYDLTKGTHKLLKVYPKDTIDVPAKNWLGK